MQRIAVLLTGFYLIGISLYAAVVWRLETTENVEMGSLFLYRVAVRHDGERLMTC